MTRPKHPRSKPAVREGVVRHVPPGRAPAKPAVRAPARPMAHVPAARRATTLEGRVVPSTPEADDDAG